MNLGNLFESIPTKLEKECFEILAQSDSVKIERIISRGHSSPENGWHDQEINEWVVLIRGSAVILFEDGDEVELQPGDYVDIPAHQRHKVTWSTPESETVWVVVHY